MMITEEHVEKALTYLRNSAKEGSIARGQLVLMEGLVKVTLAREQAKAPPGTSATAAEAIAKGSEAYEEAIKAHSAAQEKFTEIQFAREAASAWIEAWRTQEASNRGTDQGHR